MNEVVKGQYCIGVGYLEKKLGDFTLRRVKSSIHRSEVVDVVGPNATGKSTMIKILDGKWIMMGDGSPTRPQFRISHNILMPLLNDMFNSGWIQK